MMTLAPAALSRDATFLEMARVMSFSLEYVPTAPESEPPWPGSMAMVLPWRPLVRL